MLAVIFLSRYISLGVFAGAAIVAVVAVLLVDDSLMMRLALFTAALVAIRHIPALIRILRRAEPRLSFAEDITYKLDE